MHKQYTIGYDAKRIVSNATGLGSYGRTLINALAPLVPQNRLLLYAPDAGREQLRTQVRVTNTLAFVYPQRASLRLQKDLWRAKGIVKDLQRDGVQLFHGLSGELPNGIRKTGIRTVVTIHDLIFLAHPEYYHWIDTKLYARKLQLVSKRKKTYCVTLTSQLSVFASSIRAVATILLPLLTRQHAKPCVKSIASRSVIS